MASLQKEAGNNKVAEAFFRWKPLVANVKALRCWGINERQTNQQQKAKLEKQMYTTLTVSPNIVKPLLNEGSYWTQVAKQRRLYNQQIVGCTKKLNTNWQMWNHSSSLNRTTRQNKTTCQIE